MMPDALSNKHTAAILFTEKPPWATAPADDCRPRPFKKAPGWICQRADAARRRLESARPVSLRESQHARCNEGPMVPLNGKSGKISVLK